MPHAFIPSSLNAFAGRPALDGMVASNQSYSLMAAKLVHTNEDLRAELGGRDCAFVPTMGALHEGHLALIRRAIQYNGQVVVSIFVNPTQFAPGEDFARYPRTLETDVPAAEQAGADLIFTPAAEEVYPPGSEPPVPPLPAVATQPGLEDAHRPGHFAGVCQVVARLFDIVRPRWAFFGEKDYQQLLVVHAMVDQENQSCQIPEPRWPNLEIVAHPTVREPDGLAQSSRNRYLSPEARRRAVGVNRALEAARRAMTPAEAEAGMREQLTAHTLNIDYAVVRDGLTLRPITAFDRPARALIAARLDNVRLIDNCALGGARATIETTEERTERDE